jgi:hypothetical protein
MHTHSDDHRPTMSQMIFKMGLPVETVSVYLLCCSLADAGKPITTTNLLEIWNGTKEILNEGLSSLEEKNIVMRIISDRQEKNVYRLSAVCEWKL